MTRVDIDEVSARAKVGLEDIKVHGACPETLQLFMFDIPAMAQELKALREELEAASAYDTTGNELKLLPHHEAKVRAEAFEEAIDVIKLALDAGRDPNYLDVLLRERMEEPAIRARSENLKLPQQRQDDHRRAPDGAEAKSK